MVLLHTHTCGAYRFNDVLRKQCRRLFIYCVTHRREMRAQVHNMRILSIISALHPPHHTYSHSLRVCNQAAAECCALLLVRTEPCVSAAGQKYSIFFVERLLAILQCFTAIILSTESSADRTLCEKQTLTQKSYVHACSVAYKNASHACIMYMWCVCGVCLFGCFLCARITQPFCARRA